MTTLSPGCGTVPPLQFAGSSQLPLWLLIQVRAVAATLTHAENSDVLFAGSVAVAVMNPPPGVWNSGNDALPLPSVVTLTNPRKFWPSPVPDESHVVLLNSSTRNVVPAVLLSVPVTPLTAAVKIGKFC